MENQKNPKPKVGQILYYEHKIQSGEVDFASLVFVDEEIKKDGQWAYTQIAIKEDYGEGVQVYNYFEAGMMSPGYTRIATDEDLAEFIKIMKEGKITDDSVSLGDWLKQIKEDSILLEAEKVRLERLIQ